MPTISLAWVDLRVTKMSMATLLDGARCRARSSGAATLRGVRVTIRRRFYTERPEEYVEVMERLSRKFETARGLVPAPVIEKNGTSKIGIIAFGTSHYAITESMDELKKGIRFRRGLSARAGFPVCRFRARICGFACSRIYVVEQNRDAQLASLLKLDLPAEQVTKLRSILHYNGLPMDAQSVTTELVTSEGPLNHGNRNSTPAPKVNRIGLPGSRLSRQQD